MGLQVAAEAIKNCEAIRFNSFITNEEALNLQKLKEQLGIKLINPDAMNFQNFIKSYESIVGVTLYDGSNDTIKQSDAIIMIGTRISIDNRLVNSSVDFAIKNQGAEFIYMHPIDDINLENSYTQFVKYEVGSEEGVLAMLASYLIKDIPTELEEYFEELDMGYLSGECSVGEEEFDLLVEKLTSRTNKILVLGEDLFAHPRATHIAKLAGAIKRCTDFNVLIIPSQTNTLGVSLICELDEDNSSKVVGFNEEGEFIISSNKLGDIEVASLDQQNGTFINIDKNVVSTTATVSYDGYCFNDIVNEILKSEKQNSCDENSEDQKRYLLDLLSIEKVKENISLDEVEDIQTYNGTVIYGCKSNDESNKETGSTDLKLLGSQSFATAAKVKDGDEVNISYNNRIFKKVFKIDKNIKGTVALYPTFDNDFHNDLIKDGYRFQKVQIQKVEA